MSQPDKNHDVAEGTHQQYLARLTGAQGYEKDVSTNIEKQKSSKIRNIALLE